MRSSRHRNDRWETVGAIQRGEIHFPGNADDPIELRVVEKQTDPEQTEKFMDLSASASRATRSGPKLKRLGANRVCVPRNDNAKSRLDYETDLRAAHDTPCNEQ